MNDNIIERSDLEDLSGYMHQIIDKIISEAGCRIPGSEGERKGAELVADELRKYCDKVEIEDFEFAPHAFLGWIKLGIILYLASFGLYHLSTHLSNTVLIILLNLLSLMIISIAFKVIWEEFFNYREYTDKYYKKKRSQNVIGHILPYRKGSSDGRSDGRPETVIIFSGHIDSAYQFNLLYYFRYLYPIIAYWGLISLVIWGVMSAVIFFASLAGYIGIIHDQAYNLFMYSIPSVVLLWFFISSDKRGNVVPGACDNLSSVSIVLAIARYLKDHKEIIPKRTEIRPIVFGSEEAGLRGSYRYVERHLDELKNVNLLVVNMDVIQNPENIRVAEFEPTTRVHHSDEAVQMVLEAAKIAGIPMKIAGETKLEKIMGQISGGTDAVAFSKQNLRATNIFGMNFMEVVKFYHQKTDTPKWIHENALENVLIINLALIKHFKEIESKIKNAKK